MSLVEDWKDRVPTQVLSNGAIRYEQFDSSGNIIGYVYMKRADEPSEEGNIWNKVVYDGIKDELGIKLNISDKATQAQAVEGQNDTKYMTPLKTKQAIKANKILYYIPTLSTSSNNSINVSDYINDDVVRLDVVLNVTFGTNYTDLKINASKISGSIGYLNYGENTVRIGNALYIDGAGLRFSIFPKQQTVHVNGHIMKMSSQTGGTGTMGEVSATYSYESLSTITFGKLFSRNIDNPVSIIQYTV